MVSTFATDNNMIRNISSSAIYDGCGFSLFYVKGDYKEVNRRMKENMPKYMNALKERELICKKYTIVESSFFGPYTLKTLILRQEPTLSKKELAQRLSEHRSNPKHGKLIYISKEIPKNNEDDDEELPDIYNIYEETIYPGDSEYKIYYFLNYITDLELREQLRYKYVRLGYSFFRLVRFLLFPFPQRRGLRF